MKRSKLLQATRCPRVVERVLQLQADCQFSTLVQRQTHQMSHPDRLRACNRLSPSVKRTLTLSNQAEFRENRVWAAASCRVSDCARWERTSTLARVPRVMKFEGSQRREDKRGRAKLCQTVAPSSRALV